MSPHPFLNIQSQNEYGLVQDGLQARASACFAFRLSRTGAGAAPMGKGTDSRGNELPRIQARSSLCSWQSISFLAKVGSSFIHPDLRRYQKLCPLTEEYLRERSPTSASDRPLAFRQTFGETGSEAFIRE